jgi:hypothetical protein
MFHWRMTSAFRGMAAHPFEGLVCSRAGSAAQAAVA